MPAAAPRRRGARAARIRRPRALTRAPPPPRRPPVRAAAPPRLVRAPQGLNKENLKLGVFSGKLEFHDLALDPKAVSRLQLPLEICAGNLSHLRIAVPWASLESKPVRVTIDGVYLLLRPTDIHALDADELHKNILRLRRLRASDLQRRLEAASAAPPEQRALTYLERLQHTVVHNMEFDVRSVHVRFEAAAGDGAVATGITLDRLSLRTASERDWREPGFAPAGPAGDVLRELRKRGVLRAAALYFDTRAPLLSRMPHGAIEAALKALIPRADETLREEGGRRRGPEDPPPTPTPTPTPNPNPPQPQPPTPTPLPEAAFVARPLSAELRYARDPEAKAASHALVVGLDEVALRLGGRQFDAALLLREEFQRLSGFYLNFRHRPKASPREDPRGWWRYAYRCVRNLLGGGERLGWPELRAHLSRRESYEALYVRTLGLPWAPPLDEAEQRRLDAMDMQIPSDIVAYFRHAAQRRVRLHEEMRAADAPPTPPPPPPPPPTPTPTPTPTPPSPRDPASVHAKVSVTLELSATLCDHRENKIAALLSTLSAGARLSRGGRLSAALDVASLRVLDLVSHDAVAGAIVRPSPSAPPGAALSVELCYGVSKAAARDGAALKVRGGPLDVVLNVPCVQQLAASFRPKRGVMAEVREALRGGIEEAHRRARALHGRGAGGGGEPTTTARSPRGGELRTEAAGGTSGGGAPTTKVPSPRGGDLHTDAAGIPSGAGAPGTKARSPSAGAASPGTAPPPAGRARGATSLDIDVRLPKVLLPMSARPSDGFLLADLGRLTLVGRVANDLRSCCVCAHAAGAHAALPGRREALAALAAPAPAGGMGAELGRSALLRPLELKALVEGGDGAVAVSAHVLKLDCAMRPSDPHRLGALAAFLGGLWGGGGTPRPPPPPGAPPPPAAVRARLLLRVSGLRAAFLEEGVGVGVGVGATPPEGYVLEASDVGATAALRPHDAFARVALCGLALRRGLGPESRTLVSATAPPAEDVRLWHAGAGGPPAPAAGPDAPLAARERAFWAQNPAMPHALPPRAGGAAAEALARGLARGPGPRAARDTFEALRLQLDLSLAALVVEALQRSGGCVVEAVRRSSRQAPSFGGADLSLSARLGAASAAVCPQDLARLRPHALALCGLVDGDGRETPVDAAALAALLAAWAAGGISGEDLVLDLGASVGAAALTLLEDPPGGSAPHPPRRGLARRRRLPRHPRPPLPRRRPLAPRRARGGREARRAPLRPPLLLRPGPAAPGPLLRAALRAGPAAAEADVRLRPLRAVAPAALLYRLARCARDLGDALSLLCGLDLYPPPRPRRGSWAEDPAGEGPRRGSWAEGPARALRLRGAAEGVEVVVPAGEGGPAGVLRFEAAANARSGAGEGALSVGVAGIQLRVEEADGRAVPLMKEATASVTVAQKGGGGGGALPPRGGGGLDVTVVTSALGLELSYHDLDAFAAVAAAVRAAHAEDVALLAANERAAMLAQSQLLGEKLRGPPAPPAPPEGSAPAPPAPNPGDRRQEEPSRALGAQPMAVRLDCEGLSLLVVNDHGAGAVPLAVLRSGRVGGEGGARAGPRAPRVDVALSLRATCEFWNQGLGEWESLVDPWTLACDLSLDPAARAAALAFSSRDLLRLNLSAAQVSALADARALAAARAARGPSRGAPPAPLRVANATGGPVALALRRGGALVGGGALADGLSLDLPRGALLDAPEGGLDLERVSLRRALRELRLEVSFPEGLASVPRAPLPALRLGAEGDLVRLAAAEGARGGAAPACAQDLVWEHERLDPLRREWRRPFAPGDPPPLALGGGAPAVALPPPPPGSWAEDWRAGRWAYAPDFRSLRAGGGGGFSRGALDMVRRRTWCRLRYSGVPPGASPPLPVALRVRHGGAQTVAELSSVVSVENRCAAPVDVAPRCLLADAQDRVKAAGLAAAEMRVAPGERRALPVAWVPFGAVAFRGVGGGVGGGGVLGVGSEFWGGLRWGRGWGLEGGGGGVGGGGWG